MKLTLIGAAAVAALAFATATLAQAAIEDPGYQRAHNSYNDGGYYREWQNSNAPVAEPDANRYHGGPKYND
jgi:hypothetical protein